MQLMTVTLRLYPVDTIISYSQQLTIGQNVQNDWWLNGIVQSELPANNVSGINPVLR